MIKISKSSLKQNRTFVSAGFHVFYDASERGNGAVAYARRRPSKKSAHGVLLSPEPRLAPIKPVIKPRPELSAVIFRVRVREVAKMFCPVSSKTCGLLLRVQNYCVLVTSGSTDWA